MNLKDLTTLANLENEGVEIEYMGALFRVRSTNYPKYRKAIRHKLGSLPGGKAQDPNFSDPLIADAMAEHLLVSFAGVKNGDVEVKDDLAGRKLLCSNVTFRTWLGEQATDISNFQEANAADDTAALSSAS